MTVQNPQPQQSVAEDDLAATVAVVRSALLKDLAIETCEVSVREPGTNGPILAAWVVPNGPLNVDRLQRLQREVSALAQCTVELIPVSTLVLDDEGHVDSEVLKKIEVVDQELLDKWESALASLPEIGRVAVVARQRELAAPRLHLSDLLPQWNALQSPAIRDPSLWSRDPATRENPGAPRPLACRAGAARDPRYAVPPTLVEALKQTAEREPGERIIIVDDDGSHQRLSYGELLRRGERILGGLRAAGVSAGEKVIFQLVGNDEILEAFWGCVLGGFVPVIAAVPKAYHESDREFQQLCRVWEALGRPWVIVSPVRNPTELASELDASKLLRLESLRKHAPDGSHHAAQPDDVAFFNLTSGSTGTPKSVMLTHRCILQRASGVNQLCGSESNDVVINWLPLDHIGSISDWHLRCVPTGCTMVYVPKEYVLAKPLRWLELIDRFRGTHSWAPNFAYSLVSHALEKNHDHTWDLSCLKTLLTAGESVSLKVIQRFIEQLAPYRLKKSVIQPAFGMAETGSGITYFQPHEESSLRFFNVDRNSLDGELVMLDAGHPDAIPFISLGPPIPGVTIKIVDEHGDTLPEHRIGRLYIQGDAVSAGYYQDEVATRAVFRDDGWFDSGDLAFLSEGELVVTGRAKESLIVNGANFYNSEIEAVVQEVAGVSASFCAACAVLPESTATEKLAIFFHTPASEDSHLHELLGNIRKTLARRLGLKPDFLLPVAKEDIPKSPIGKLLRSRLAEHFNRGEFAEVLRRVDLLLANENTMPDWFFRKTWRRKQWRAADSHPTSATVLFLGNETTTSHALGAALQEGGTRCVRVERGDRFAKVAEDNYRLEPSEYDDYHRLLQVLRDLGRFPDRIIHSWNHGPADNRDSMPHRNHSLGASGLDLLALVRALNDLKETGQSIQLDILTSCSQVVAAHDSLISERSVISGLLKTIAAENPWLVCRHVDAPDEPCLESALVDELNADPADREIALRVDGRFVPRLEQVSINELSGPVPFKDGGRYVIHGGLDGVGVEIARYLAARHEARVLLLGDSTRREHAGAEAKLAANVTVEDYQHPDELPERIAEFERHEGQLDGIFHLSGLYRERALAEETPEDLDRDLASDVRGCQHLCAIARSRPSLLFISFTSANGFFGGATVGAISAAASYVTALTDELRADKTVRCYNFAWSLWSHVADKLSGDASPIARASGFYPVSLKEGLYALLAGLRLGAGSYLIGLDAQHYRVASMLARKPRALLQPVVCFSAPTLIARDSLAALAVSDRYGNLSRARFQQLQEPDSIRRTQLELWPSVAEYFVYDDLLYHALAHDERRNHSYKVAIRQTVKDKIVVEVGTGKEAILARFCVEAGARKIYAIEIGDEAFRDASALVAKLGLQDKIELIHGDATKVTLPELADVCVSEIVGPIGGCEGAALLINDARRFLKPDGIMLPAQSVTKIAATTMPDSLFKNPGFNEVPGSYVSRIFNEVGRPFDLRLCVKNFDSTNLISSTAVFEDLDFNKPIPLEETHSIDLVVEKDARLDGFLVWLNLHTIAGEVIDTLKYEYCWLPVFFPVFDPGVRVTTGDRITATIERWLCENGLNPDFRVRGRLLRTTGEQVEFAHDSLHHEGPHRGTPFYDRLFNREPGGAYLDGYQRELYRNLSELPLTANGAIDRDMLPVADRANSEAYVAPATETERKIAGIWEDILDIGQVSLHGNFFELGGHSLLLVQMHERLRDIFDSPITLVELFKYPTVSSLAQFLDGGKEMNATAATLGRVQAERRRSRRSMAADETDIAVIGMSCRFPGADDVETFWNNLSRGVESITFFSDDEIVRSGIDARTARDPNYVKASSVLSDIAGFDPDFFGLSTREAVLMDPQQRLFLECAWEVLEDAGYDPLRYPGLIGVYAGASMNTYLLNQVYPNRSTLDTRDDLGVTTLDSLGGFQLMIGSDKDYLPTQVAYRLNLRGPAVNVQTACSTTLVTIHLACRSLLDGESDICLAGGASVKVPQKAGHLFQDGMIVSPDGHCRAFDARAQGTIFGSGVGIVALKRLRDAMADGDHIYAVIKGTAINNDGGTKVGYMSPSGDGQASVAAEALAVSNVSAESITYVEAHGTGTELGDPIEIAGLNQAFRGEEPRPRSCAVGSVKTNVGHLQIASGVAGFIKTALALYHAQIPATLHFEKPNSAIDFDSTPFYINTELIDWQVPNGKRLAAVNSLGIGGTNAHVILEEAPRRTGGRNELDRSGHVLTLSGKTEAALWQHVSRYVDYLGRHPELEAGDVCFTANAGRHHFDYRLAVSGRTTVDLRNALAEKLRQHQEGSAPVVPVAGAEPRVVFLFTGQGAQYAGMCRELFETQPTFRRTIERCQEILSGILDVPLLHVLYPEREGATNGRGDLINQTAYTQPALFAVEYALAELWRSWGIEPAACLGHSVGQFVAACVAGVFSLEDGLALVAERARLMQELPERGAMAMVHAHRNEIATLLACSQGQVSVAAVNSPTNTVISGSQDALEQVLSGLDAAGVKWQMLATSHAFHSRLMDPMLDEFEKRAATITLSPARIPVISNHDGMPAGDEIATPAFWRQHAREPVRFMDGIKQLERQGHSLFVELGPHPALLSLARETWTGPDAKWLPSCRRNRSDWDSLLASVSELHLLGCKVDWQGFDLDYQRRRVRLPTYAFQRRQCWLEAPAREARSEGTSQSELLRSAKTNGHPLLGRRIRSAVTLYESELSVDAPVWLKDHRVFKSVITPAAATLEMVLAAATAHFKTSAVTIENVAILQPLMIPSAGRCTVQLILDPGEGESAAFRILVLDESSGEEEWKLHMSGNVSAHRWPPLSPSQNGHFLHQPSGAVPGQQWYEQCRESGADFGAAFFSMEWFQRDHDTTHSSISIPEHLADDDGYRFHPILLDGALQTAVASLPESGVHLPLSFDRLEIRSTPARRAFCKVQQREPLGAETSQVDVELLDDQGELLARIVGLTLRRASREAISATQSPALDRYQVAWKPADLTMAATASTGNARRYLIISDCKAAAESVVERLQHYGAFCTVGLQATSFEHPSADEFSLNLDQPDDIRKMLDAVTKGERLDAVLFLSLAAGTIDTDTTPELAERDCVRLLNFVQAAAQLGGVNGPSFCVVTRGAQPVGNQTEPVDPAKSALWGMANVISLEHSEWQTCLVDLDQRGWEQDLKFVVDEVLSRSSASVDEKEDRVAYRAGQRHVARLVPSVIAARDDQFTIHGDACYLITGGLGGVGLKLAQWLAEQGAGTIVLAGRRPVQESAEPELQKLRQSSARIIIEQLDVTDDEQVDSLVARINAEVAPLRGVIHAAGLLDDAIIMRQRTEQFLGVLQPKTRGAWNLHVKTRHLALDFFLLCSSMASVTGSPGQSNYSAANAFLDGLAWHRHELGLTALSINWGQWDGVGLTSQGHTRNRWQLEGFGKLTVDQSLSHLNALLRSTAVQVGVSPIEFSRLPDLFQRLPLLRAFARPKTESEQGNRLFRDRLDAAPAGRRRTLLDKFVQENVAAVLGVEARELTDRRAGFSSLGMDSLATLELRNRLQAGLRESLPAALAFHYPNVETLVNFLAEGVINDHNATNDEPAKVAPEQQAVQSHSRSDLNKLLAERMAALKNTLDRPNDG